MGKTRGEWARGLALRLGNPLPSREILLWIAAWTKAENTEARYNPLATKWIMPGSNAFNTEGVGVQNYLSEEQGFTATVKTLNGIYRGYEDIREGIRTNDVARAQEGLANSPWGTNATLVQSIYEGVDTLDEQLRAYPQDYTPISGIIEWVATPGGLVPMTREQQTEYTETGRLDGNRSLIEQTQDALTVTDADARRVVYGVGGVLLFGLGVFILVRNVLPVPQIRVK